MKDKKDWEEKIEVIINRHAPFDNFEIKEMAAKDIYKEVCEPIEQEAYWDGIKVMEQECDRAIQAERQRIREEVEIMVRGAYIGNSNSWGGTPDKMPDGEKEGYNHAIKDVLQLLSPEPKEEKKTDI